MEAGRLPYGLDLQPVYPRRRRDLQRDRGALHRPRQVQTYTRRLHGSVLADLLGLDVEGLSPSTRGLKKPEGYMASTFPV